MIASMHVASIKIIILIYFFSFTFNKKMQSPESFNYYFTKGKREKEEFIEKKKC